MRITKPRTLPQELVRKIRGEDRKNLTVREMIQYHLYAGRSHLEIAQILTRNVSFAKLREEWKKVGKLLGFSFEDYRKIWRGQNPARRVD